MSILCKVVKSSSSHRIAMHSTGLETKFNVSFKYFVWRAYPMQKHKLELYFYLNTVNLSDKIIIKIITIYFNLYKHDLKI